MIMPKDDIRISCATEGVIVAYPVEEGERVQAGDIIVKLDDRMEKVEVAHAQALVERAAVELEKSKKDWARTQELYDEKIASEKQFLEAQAALAIAQANYTQAQQSLERAKIMLDYRYLKSPTPGIFYKKIKSVGESLNRYEVAARVIDDSALEMTVYASTDLFGQFQPGDGVYIQLLDGPAAFTQVLATVFYVDELIDPASGTFRIKLSLQPQAGVYSGLGALFLPETHQPHINQHGYPLDQPVSRPETTQ